MVTKSAPLAPAMIARPTSIAWNGVYVARARFAVPDMFAPSVTAGPNRPINHAEGARLDGLGGTDAVRM